MARSALPSRAVIVAAIAALAALPAGVGTSSAQSPAVPIPVQPANLDPVSAAVAEASRRFGVPEPWIWSVMRVESAGNARAVSRAGAMGLMQVMPGTYAELRARYGLGPDPFQVRDNVLAGTAYLREMHDRYGVQGMLAAYNAGPARWEAYVRAGRRLPSETVGYLARLAPEVGATAVPMIPGAQPGGIASTPGPTLFVQIGSGRAAAETAAERVFVEQPSAGRVVSAEPMHTIFVLRSASEPASSASSSSSADQADSAPSSAPANPLFVPIRTGSDRT